MVYAASSNKKKKIQKNWLRRLKRSTILAEESLKHKSDGPIESLHEIQTHHEKSVEIGIIKRI